MKRIILLGLSIACALLIMAQPAASDKPPIGGGPGPATVSPHPTDSPLPTPAPTVTPFVSPLQVPQRLPKEKPDRAEPIWLTYWQWLLFR